MIDGLGKCGVCYRQIAEFTEIRTAKLGDGRPYVVHKECAPEQATKPKPIVNLGSYIPPIVVTTAAEIAPNNLPEARPEPQPSMPTPEQVAGKRRGRPPKASV